MSPQTPGRGQRGGVETTYLLNIGRKLEADFLPIMNTRGLLVLPNSAI